MKKRSNNPLHDYARYSSIAFQMLAIICGGIFGGYWLDKWLKWGFPVFTLVLSLFSVALAIYVVIREVLRPK
jgi:predicted MFS family arabinose efflux permease